MKQLCIVATVLPRIFEKEEPKIESVTVQPVVEKPKAGEKPALPPFSAATFYNLDSRTAPKVGDRVLLEIAGEQPELPELPEKKTGEAAVVAPKA